MIEMLPKAAVVKSTYCTTTLNLHNVKSQLYLNKKRICSEIKLKDLFE